MLTSYPSRADTLGEWVDDARTRTLELVADLTDEQLTVPPLETVNPFLWEIGHVAWFQEKWILRHLHGEPPIKDGADQLFDSVAVLHDHRWQLCLPTRDQVIAYASAVKDRVQSLIDRGTITDDFIYAVKLAVFHEDMHAEAFTYMRQTLGYPLPHFLQAATGALPAEPSQRALQGDVHIPASSMNLGACPGETFVFDNEKWAHPVEVRPFAISAETVTEEVFADFVNDAGYQRREFWDDAGWAWRERAGAMQPVYWIAEGSRWRRRHFDVLEPLGSRHPMVHVNWYEANAWCCWAGRRLPSEAEWEVVAASSAESCSPTEKRRYPWGDARPTRRHANLDGDAADTTDVAALPEGDSGWGCRQLLGNVWEWTSSDFEPYPGFAPDWYREYSQPWFSTHKVLRGGCWATRSRLIRNTYRNFFLPERRDVFAGFRTVAL